MARLVVLTRESPFGFYLINKVSLTNEVAGVVFESAPLKTQLAMFNKRRKHLGLLRVIDQILLILFVRLVERSKEKKMMKGIFNDQPFDRLVKGIDILNVKSVNSAEASNFTAERKPDLVIVNGTSLLRDELINQFHDRIINIHVGITPEYRGSHGGFWALYNGEPDKVGVTVHLINPGIDTGPILFQETVSVDSADTLRTIAYKQQKKGAELVLKSIDQFQKGELKGYYKNSAQSKLYYPPGLTQYLRLKYKRTGVQF